MAVIHHDAETGASGQGSLHFKKPFFHTERPDEKWNARPFWQPGKMRFSFWVFRLTKIYSPISV